ncbi:hypothetical protein BC830DRAFT_1124941, partial [Chytriomyces sp. MP71]
MTDSRTVSNPGMQGGGSNKHWSGKPMDWNNSVSCKQTQNRIDDVPNEQMGSRSFSSSQPLYGSKRDLWELGSREAMLYVGKPEAGVEPIKASGKSEAFFAASHAVTRPFVSSYSSQSQSQNQSESEMVAAARRNDIFAVCHLVSKPTSKMSQAELDALACPERSYSYSERYIKGVGLVF